MKFLHALLRFLLSLRYKINISGEELLNYDKGILVMPNHIAHVDPQIMSATIYKYRPVVPVIAENIYKIPILNILFKKMKAIPVSDLQAGSRDTDIAKTINTNVIQALTNHSCVLIYPSGQISGQGYEKIFNKKSAHEIVKDAPMDTRIIGVRTTGLWGSMWSRAWLGKTPNVGRTLFKALGIVLANLIFFAPRRKVDIEFVDLTKEIRQKSLDTRLNFNNYLESFYNAKGEEPVLFLKHFFFVGKSNRQLPERIEGSVEDLKRTASVDHTTIPQDIVNEVVRIMREEGSVDATHITLTSNLTMDLNIDSLNIVLIVTAIENHFKVEFKNEVTDLKTVADLCLVAMGKREIELALKPSFLYRHNTVKSNLKVEMGSIPELFLKTFTSFKNEPFAFDKIMGCTTRKEFFLKAMVVSKILAKEIPDKHVGIMLPALQSTTLLVAATYLAGKVPVMLNWTVGKKVLEHCVDTVKLNHIVTATSFFDRVREMLPDSVKSKCMFFEKKVQQAGLGVKLSGLFSSWFPSVRKVDVNETAVILFTSGSESLPKAVPLSHKNITSDLYGVFSTVEISNHEIFMGFLPPFHSFGFVVLTVLPLITGVKVCYSPDPAANREILKIMIHNKASMLLSTPTFLKMILSIATKEDLCNLNYAITGAESLHASIIEQFKEKAKSEAIALEGYGITECSPVLTINPPQKQKFKSVGVFIKGVEHLIVDLTNNAPLPTGQAGMIMVRGNNIFGGYLGANTTSPFVTINGNEYYKTGDLGYVDEDGYLFITGRLKRFIKIAGEMISLPAIESVLLEKYGSAEETVLAVEGSDNIEPPQIVLFSKIELDIQEINMYLKSKGFSNLVRVHKFQKIESIPLLGTGKTDYKALKEQIK